MKAYCVKCRTKREMKAPKEVTKKGKTYTKGVCSNCGTGMVCFGGKK